MLKIDDIYETTITGLENEGKGVSKIDGMVCFVPKTLPNEKVRIRITEIKKNFARGKLIEVLEESDKRIKPTCPYYDECGGCNLRHQAPEENLIFKKEKVENAIKRIGKLDVKIEDVIPSYKEDNYRNKVSLKVENDKIGYYGEGTYQLVDIEECMLAEKEINDALRVVKGYLRKKENEIKSITIKHGNAKNEILIDIYSTSDKDIDIIDYLISIRGLSTVIFNDKIVYGNGYIKQITNGLMFNCSSKSFFQVNSMQMEKLYNEAISLAKIKNSDTILDLYSGTGTISCIMAGHAKKVIAVEIVEDACLDAKQNLITNNISNVQIICGDATKEINKIKEKIDIIFVDPPRAGVDRKALAIMKKINPKKIIYISCNPVTMARDLNLLSDMYKVKKVQPVDMFPNTSHVECITLLERK